jgi:hypothetical protein
LLLLTEEGVVRLIDCAPSDAAVTHQIERFQQRLERAPKRGSNSALFPLTPLLNQHAVVWFCRGVWRLLYGTGIGALIALEGAQVRDDGTLYLVDLLRKANHRVNELEKSLQLASNKEALAAARKSLNVIVSEGSASLHFQWWRSSLTHNMSLYVCMYVIAMETADRALAYINNQVTLNTVHNLYRFLPLNLHFLVAALQAVNVCI